MSNFVNRLSGVGEFSIGAAKFVVTEVRGGLIRVVQTHSYSGGVLLPAFTTTNVAGVISTPTTAMPTGFIVPQTHSELNVVKQQFADLDSRVLSLCSACQANGVTVQDMTGACTSCQANYDTIAYLKTV